jgi:hypothetical protein
MTGSKTTTLTTSATGSRSDWLGAFYEITYKGETKPVRSFQRLIETLPDLYIGEADIKEDQHFDIVHIACIAALGGRPDMLSECRNRRRRWCLRDSKRADSGSPWCSLHNWFVRSKAIFSDAALVAQLKAACRDIHHETGADYKVLWSTVQYMKKRSDQFAAANSKPNDISQRSTHSLESIPLYSRRDCSSDSHILSICFYRVETESDAGAIRHYWLPYISSTATSGLYLSLRDAADAHGSHLKVRRSARYPTQLFLRSSRPGGSAYRIADLRKACSRLGDVIPDFSAICAALDDELYQLEGPRASASEHAKTLLTMMTQLSELYRAEVKNLTSKAATIASVRRIDALERQSATALHARTVVTFLGICGTGKTTTCGRWALADNCLSSSLGMQILQCRQSERSPSAQGTFIPVRLGHATSYQCRVVFYDELDVMANIMRLERETKRAQSNDGKHSEDVFDVISQTAERGYCSGSIPGEVDLLPATRTSIFNLAGWHTLTPSHSAMPEPALVAKVSSVSELLCSNKALFMACKYIEVRAPVFRSDADMIDTPGLGESDIVTFRTSDIVKDSHVIVYATPMASIRGFKTTYFKSLWDNGFFRNLHCRPNEYIENLRYLMPLHSNLDTADVHIPQKVQSAENETKTSIPCAKSLQSVANLPAAPPVVDAVRPKLREFLHHASVIGDRHEESRWELQRAIDSSRLYRFLGVLETTRSTLEQRLRWLHTRAGRGQLEQSHRAGVDAALQNVRDAMLDYDPKKIDLSPLATQVHSEILSLATRECNGRRISSADTLLTFVKPYLVQLMCGMLEHCFMLNEQAVLTQLLKQVQGSQLESLIHSSNCTVTGSMRWTEPNDMCDIAASAVTEQLQNDWKSALSNLKQRVSDHVSRIVNEHLYSDLSEPSRFAVSVSDSVTRAAASMLNKVEILSALQPLVTRTVAAMQDQFEHVVKDMSPESLSYGLSELLVDCTDLGLRVRHMPSFAFAFAGHDKLSLTSGFDELVFGAPTYDKYKKYASVLETHVPLAELHGHIHIDWTETNTDTIVVHQQAATGNISATIPTGLLHYLCSRPRNGVHTHPIFHSFDAFKLHSLQRKLARDLLCVSPFDDLPQYEADQVVFFVAPQEPAGDNSASAVVRSAFDIVHDGVCTALAARKVTDSADIADDRDVLDESSSTDTPMVWFIEICSEHKNGTGVPPQHVMWNIILMFVRRFFYLKPDQLPSSTSANHWSASHIERVHALFSRFAVVDGARASSFCEWRRGVFQPCAPERMLHRMYSIMDERAGKQLKSADVAASVVAALEGLNKSRLLRKSAASQLRKAVTVHGSSQRQVIDHSIVRSLCKLGQKNGIFSASKCKKMADRVRKYVPAVSIDADIKNHCICVGRNFEQVGILLQSLLEHGHAVPVLTEADLVRLRFDPEEYSDDDSESDEDEDEDEDSQQDAKPSSAAWFVNLDALHKRFSQLALQDLSNSAAMVVAPCVPSRRLRLGQDSELSSITHTVTHSPNSSGVLCVDTDAMFDVGLCPFEHMKVSHADRDDAWSAFGQWRTEPPQHDSKIPHKQWQMSSWLTVFGDKDRYVAREFWYKSQFAFAERRDSLRRQLSDSEPGAEHSESDAVATVTVVAAQAMISQNLTQTQTASQIGSDNKDATMAVSRPRGTKRISRHSVVLPSNVDGMHDQQSNDASSDSSGPRKRPKLQDPDQIQNL